MSDAPKKEREDFGSLEIRFHKNETFSNRVYLNYEGYPEEVLGIFVTDIDILINRLQIIKEKFI